MMFPFRQRSIVRSQVADFAPTAEGGGLFNFDRWLDFCPDGFHIKVAFSYYREGGTSYPMDTALLEFVNPTPEPTAVGLLGGSVDRRVVLEDATGTLTSFIEDNLGTWWALPMRVKPDLPYEVHFTTSGFLGEGSRHTLMIDVAYFPNWPSADLHAVLRRLAECQGR